MCTNKDVGTCSTHNMYTVNMQHIIKTHVIHKIEYTGLRSITISLLVYSRFYFLSAEPLTIFFKNDTPLVNGTGVFHAQFASNRPDVMFTCRLVGYQRVGGGLTEIVFDITQDCKCLHALESELVCVYVCMCVCVCVCVFVIMCVCA